MIDRDWGTFNVVGADVSNGAVMNGHLKYEDGNLRIELYLTNSGELVMEIPQDSKDFAAMVEMMGLTEIVALVEIEHDLNEDCECSTCLEANRIRTGTAAPPTSRSTGQRTAP